ncbi:hypothetical protein F5X68DRAFT_241258 [Plectosphaerella plurivora]|uniref:Enoyl reductase (ER) domain-containing protein n=1 Tax=Plectosphaerella plurivora TaxID=936078 RepID=A0A9P8VA84_9PEZI|nr:hypothetical protein F5X68DRAFT_241258 [Plectosphaerella plurivora]
MQAIRIRPSETAPPFSPSNPAPSSALILVEDVDIPSPRPGHILVRVHAATVTRDELTWPESYVDAENHTPGFDFAGVVAAVQESDAPTFKPGDEVFAFDMDKGSAWAEYTTVAVTNLAPKPKVLSFEEAATVPMSALTAWQALFVHSGLPEPDFGKGAPRSRGCSVLITGASGAVGCFLVQLASAAGLRVIAASGSNKRNAEFLQSLGASETVEYDKITTTGRVFDAIIDTVGGDPLKKAWDLVADGGSIVTVDSKSFEFNNVAAPVGKEHVKKKFFIIEPSGEQLLKISMALDIGLLRTFVAWTFPLAEAKAAYEKASGRLDRRGKVVLTI